MEEKMSNKVRIGTRKSLLAVIQTEIVKDRILEAFPDREIIGIDCRPVIKQHGSLHCCTMQFPEVRK